MYSTLWGGGGGGGGSSRPMIVKRSFEFSKNSVKSFLVGKACVHTILKALKVFEHIHAMPRVFEFVIDAICRVIILNFGVCWVGFNLGIWAHMQFSISPFLVTTLRLWFPNNYFVALGVDQRSQRVDLW